jgi:hypothetical protein
MEALSRSGVRLCAVEQWPDMQVSAVRGKYVSGIRMPPLGQFLKEFCEGKHLPSEAGKPGEFSIALSRLVFQQNRPGAVTGSNPVNFGVRRQSARRSLHAVVGRRRAPRTVALG